MDGSSGSGLLLSSAKRSGGGGGGNGGVKLPVFKEGLQLYSGPSGGDSQRNWQFTISPQVNDTNALTVQYKKNGLWQIASVFTAREQNH